MFLYKKNNFYYEPHEAYIPNQFELCLVYTQKEFTKNEIIYFIKHTLCEIDKNKLLDDFNDKFFYS